MLLFKKASLILEKGFILAWREITTMSRINLHISSEMEGDRFCFFFVEVYYRFSSSLSSHETFCVAEFADSKPVHENVLITWHLWSFALKSLDSTWEHLKALNITLE